MVELNRYQPVTGADQDQEVPSKAELPHFTTHHRRLDFFAGNPWLVSTALVSTVTSCRAVAFVPMGIVLFVQIGDDDEN